MGKLHMAVPFTATATHRCQKTAVGEIFLFPSMILSRNRTGSYPGLFKPVESGKLEISNTAFLGITS